MYSIHIATILKKRTMYCCFLYYGLPFHLTPLSYALSVKKLYNDATNLVVILFLKFCLVCYMCSVKLLVLNGYLLMQIIPLFQLNVHRIHPAMVSLACFSCLFPFC